MSVEINDKCVIAKAMQINDKCVIAHVNANKW